MSPVRYLQKVDVVRGDAILVLAAIAAITFGLIMGALFYRSYTGSQKRADACIVALRVRDATRGLLVDAKQIVTHPPAGIHSQTPQERKLSIEFYDRNIAKLNGVTCSTKR